MDLLDELTPDDLDPEQRELADCIGMTAYKKLVATYAGSSLNIRMPGNLTIKQRNRKLIQDFNGYNFGELARKYGLTERQIRYIVADHVHTERCRPPPGQMSLFDDDIEMKN